MTPSKAIINPLDLPEIRTVLGHYLSRHDLVQCLRVCKSWHASFLSLIWFTISIKQRQSYPTVETFRQHRKLIKDLTYNANLWREYKPIQCSNLTFLTIDSFDTSPIIVAPYHQLRRLSINGPLRAPLSKMSVWNPANHTHLHNLSSLELDMVQINPRDNTTFWNMCIRLKSLTIKSIYISELPDRTMTFDRLETLSVALRSGAQFESQLDWFAQCPNLTSLSWWLLRLQRTSALDSFAERLGTGFLPELRRIHLRWARLTDELLSRIIKEMGRIESMAGVRDFGRLSMAALRHHFHNVKVLDIGLISPPTSPMIIEFLTSLPKLEELSVGELGVLMGKDIIRSSHWACKESLKVLSVRIAIPADQHRDSHQEQILERLSELKNLEQLRLLSPLITKHATGLDLRLGKGLEMLWTLKKLRGLNLDDASQHMTTPDVKVNQMDVSSTATGCRGI